MPGGHPRSRTRQMGPRLLEVAPWWKGEGGGGDRRDAQSGVSTPRPHRSSKKRTPPGFAFRKGRGEGEGGGPFLSNDGVVPPRGISAGGYSLPGAYDPHPAHPAGDELVEFRTLQ